MASKRPEVLLLVGMSGAGRSASSNVFDIHKTLVHITFLLSLEMLVLVQSSLYSKRERETHEISERVGN